MSSLPLIDVREREARLFRALDEQSISCLFVPDLANVRWLTGFSGSAGCALINANTREVHLMTDSRYKDQSHDELSLCSSSASIHMARSHTERVDVVARIVGTRGITVDPDEVTVSLHKLLTGAMSVDECRGPTPLQELRRVKDAAEIARIEKAAAIADAALQEVVSWGLCGLSERDIRSRLEHEMASKGADAPSFDTIVATGPNAAMPHHRPTGATVEAGHLVIIDMGALVDGYHSDMTRTVKVGVIAEEDEHLFNLVRHAQEEGVNAVCAGAAGSDVDDACRTVFENAGVADLYVHGTGHGVGLDIHEEPFFHRASTQTLMEHEVVTVEPGLYRVGVSGTRIEDLVMVTSSGCRLLSTTPKELSCPPSPRTT